jgi:hypothetical protein
MDDLLQLNRTIAEYWLGQLNARQQNYLSFAEVCLALLPYSAEQLASALAASKNTRDNKLRVLELNRRYLSFARLASKDITAGKHEMLIKLGINMSQAKLLSSLSTEEIALLALVWQGPIVRFRDRSFLKGAALEPGAAKHHATAFMATSIQ